MLKLMSVLLLFGLVLIAAQGSPFGYNDIAASAVGGDWNSFVKFPGSIFRFPNRRLSQGFNNNFEGIKNLQPQGPGSHVYGEAEYKFHSSSSVNGRKSERSGGRRVINKDGQIEEYELE